MKPNVPKMTSDEAYSIVENCLQSCAETNIDFGKIQNALAALPFLQDAAGEVGDDPEKFERMRHALQVCAQYGREVDPYVELNRRTNIAIEALYGTAALKPVENSGGVGVPDIRLIEHYGNKSPGGLRVRLVIINMVFQARATARTMRRIDASSSHASDEAIVDSQSLASRRQRFSHAKLRSTTHRLGRTTNPLAASDRLTISIAKPSIWAIAVESFSPA